MSHVTSIRDSNRWRILLVDDDSAVHDLVRATAPENCTVTSERDGAAGLARLRQGEPFDAVVCDIVMPRLDGLSFRTAMLDLEIHTLVPFLFLTARDRPAERIRGWAQLIDGYLVKPFHPGELWAVIEGLARRHHQIASMAYRDPLTRIANRRRIELELDYELARSRRTGGSLSLLLLDIDHFKRVNDTHGHPAGDRVLRAIAEVLSASCRDLDRVGRFGGEEFLVVAPETSKSQARKLANRLIRAIAARRVTPGGNSVTASGGLASYPEDATDAVGLVARADEALYVAKRTGRDRIVVATGHAAAI